jgi:hypothetical protein
MKFNTLRAIAHNLAHSFGSGIGLLVGMYDFHVFSEASRMADGQITVDFLAGKALPRPSTMLRTAVGRYLAALPAFCVKHSCAMDDFRQLSVRYSTPRFTRRMSVTVEDRTGRRCVDEYVGWPARRAKITDRQGRVRTQRRGQRSYA